MKAYRLSFVEHQEPDFYLLDERSGVVASGQGKGGRGKEG